MRPFILSSAFLAAAALSSPVLAPVTAHAQGGQQSTPTETEFREGLRAQQGRHYSKKRHQIIRSERNTPTDRTRGSGY